MDHCKCAQKKSVTKLRRRDNFVRSETESHCVDSVYLNSTQTIINENQQNAKNDINFLNSLHLHISVTFDHHP